MTGTLVETTPPPIDRRLRARRIEVRRREGRRRLRRLIALVVASALLAAAWGVTRSPLLDVDHVAVVGSVRTDAEAVVAAAAIERGTALLDVDLEAAAARVATLPWIRTAQVDRSWRGTITVTITERAPVAVVVGPDGGRWLVDAEGAVLAPDGGGTDLLAVEGLQPPAPGRVLEPVPEAALALADSLAPRIRELVAAVVVTPDGAIELRLHPRPGERDAEGAARVEGGRVLLGDGRALADKVHSLTTVLDQVDLVDLAILDVRVPSNPVVTRTITEVDR